METNIQIINNQLPHLGSKKRNKSQASLSSSPTSVHNPSKVLKMTFPVAMQEMDNTSEFLPQEWRELSMDQKVDRLMLKLMALDEIKCNVDSIIEEREQQVGNELLLQKMATLEGKNVKLEKQVESLSAKLEDLEWREMRDNLIFYNVEEAKGENCRLVIEKFLTEEMQLSHQDIYSPQNISGEVRIDVAHRVSKTGPNPRPIVTKFVTRHDKETVLKQAKNLRGKKYFVSEQLPSKMKECRLAQNDTLKQLREKHPDKHPRLR